MIQLIEEAELRNNAFMDKGCSQVDLATALQLAQEVMLSTKLGEELYNKIVLDLQSAPDTDYTKLFFDKCYNTLMYYTAYQLAKIKFARITSSGVSSFDGDDSEPNGLEEHKTFTENIRSLYFAYENKMMKYIEANKSKFPEYVSESTEETDFSDSVQASDTNALRLELEEEGIYLN